MWATNATKWLQERTHFSQNVPWDNPRRALRGPALRSGPNPDLVFLEFRLESLDFEADGSKGRLNLIRPRWPLSWCHTILVGSVQISGRGREVGKSRNLDCLCVHLKFHAIVGIGLIADDDMMQLPPTRNITHPFSKLVFLTSRPDLDKSRWIRKVL